MVSQVILHNYKDKKKEEKKTEESNLNIFIHMLKQQHQDVKWKRDLVAPNLCLKIKNLRKSSIMNVFSYRRSSAGALFLFCFVLLWRGRHLFWINKCFILNFMYSFLHSGLRSIHEGNNNNCCFIQIIF